MIVSRETPIALLVANLAVKVAGVGGLSRAPLAYARFPHPDDWFLFLVLAEVEDGYVIWTYNAQLDSLENGHYYTGPHAAGIPSQMANAYIEFISKLTSKTRAYVVETVGDGPRT